MDVNTLYEELKKLVENGKGHYTVLLEDQCGGFESPYECGVDDDTNDFHIIYVGFRSV